MTNTTHLSGKRFTRALGVRGLLGVFLITGCSVFGGQSGDDSSAEGLGCEKRRRTELGEDTAASPVLGIAPADILAWAEREEELDARWLAPPDGVTTNVTPAPVSGTLRVRRANGAAAELVDDQCGQAPELSIPVTVELSSADGALAETWTSALRVTRTNFARLSVEFPFTSLQGSLRAATGGTDLRLLHSGLAAALTPQASSGALSTALEQRTRQAVTLLPAVRLLRWPADSPCGALEPAQPLDPAGAVTRRVATANASVWTGTFEDGTSTHVTVHVEPAGVVCEPEMEEPYAPARLTLATRDARVNVTLDVALEPSEVDSTVNLGRPLSGPWGGSAERFTQMFGTFGLDLTPYDGVYLETELTLREGAQHGRLALIGYRNECPPCTSNTSCPGCAGLTPSTLRELDFTGTPLEPE